METVAAAQTKYAKAATDLTATVSARVEYANTNTSSPARLAVTLEPGARLLAVSPEMSAKLQKLASSWSVSDTRVVRISTNSGVTTEMLPLLLAGGSGGELMVDDAWIQAERAKLAAGVRPNLLRDGNPACQTVRGVLAGDTFGGEIAGLKNASLSQGADGHGFARERPTGRGFVPVAGVSAAWREPWSPAVP
jgi:hypothetical protein